MGELFLTLFNRSVAAGWLILAAAGLRLILKKAPKSVHCLLWLLVGVRLACPFSIESALSLIPSAEIVRPSATGNRLQITTGISAVNSLVNPYLAGHYDEGPTVQAGLGERVIQVCAVVWLIGMAALLLCSLVSYLRLRRRVSTAVHLRGDLWQSDQIASPFILGLFRPRIYLPFGMEESAVPYVEAHERAHLRRHDHWWKPIGFLILTVYWFNPLVWAAYVLLCRDIELACDEQVICQLGEDCKASYSGALLRCSASRRSVAACPLAFGEVGVKQRVKSILNYKRPAFWIVALSLAVCVVAAVCFLTDPRETGAVPDSGLVPVGEDYLLIGGPISSVPPPVWTDRDTLESMWALLQSLTYQEAEEGAEAAGFALSLELLCHGETYSLTVGQNGVGTMEGVEGPVRFGDPGLYEYLWSLYSRETGSISYTGGALLYQQPALSFLPTDGSQYAGVVEDGGTLTIRDESGAPVFIGELNREKTYSRKAFLSIFDDFTRESLSDRLDAMVPQTVKEVTARVYQQTDEEEGVGRFTIWELSGSGEDRLFWLSEGGLEPLRLYELIDTSEAFPFGAQGVLWTYSEDGLLPVRFDGEFVSVEIWIESGAVSSLPPWNSGSPDGPSGSDRLILEPGGTVYWDPAIEDEIPESAVLAFRLLMADGTAIEDRVELRSVSDQASLYGFCTYGLSMDWLGAASSRFHLCGLSVDADSGVCVISPSSAVSTGIAAAAGQGIPAETEEAAPET